MKLWIAHCIDRHTDPLIRVFDTPDAAIGFAKKFAQEGARHSESYEESPVQGWLYHAQYSCEGDGAYVTEATLNDAS